MIGKLLSVKTEQLGSSLSAAADTGAMAISVEDITVFGDSGELLIGEETISYTVDHDNETIELASALGADYVAETEVFLYPAVERKIGIVEHEGSELEAEIDSFWAYLENGSRDEDSAEIVRIENGRIVAIKGQAPTFDGQFTKPGSMKPSALDIRQMVVEGLTLQNNTPGAGSITWSACTVYFGGQAYEIPGGNTDKYWLLWNIGASIFTAADDPVDGYLIIAVNKSGTAFEVWNNNGHFGTIDANLVKANNLAAITAILGGSAGGARIEMVDARLQIYDGSNVLRLVLDNDSLDFYDGGGNFVGTIIGPGSTAPSALISQIQEDTTEEVDWYTFAQQFTVGADDIALDSIVIKAGALAGYANPAVYLCQDNSNEPGTNICYIRSTEQEITTIAEVALDRFSESHILLSPIANPVLKANTKYWFKFAGYNTAARYKTGNPYAGGLLKYWNQWVTPNRWDAVTGDMYFKINGGTRTLKIDAPKIVLGKTVMDDKYPVLHPTAQQLIQKGIVAVTSSGWTAAGSIYHKDVSVTFPITFSTAPTMPMPMPESGGSVPHTANATSITTEGCSIRVYRHTNSAPSVTTNVHWIAVGT